MAIAKLCHKPELVLPAQRLLGVVPAASKSAGRHAARGKHPLFKKKKIKKIWPIKYN